MRPLLIDPSRALIDPHHPHAPLEQQAAMTLQEKYEAAFSQLEAAVDSDRAGTSTELAIGRFEVRVVCVPCSKRTRQVDSK
jgi:hypothetical protein